MQRLNAFLTHQRAGAIGDSAIALLNTFVMGSMVGFIPAAAFLAVVYAVQDNRPHVFMPLVRASFFGNLILIMVGIFFLENPALLLEAAFIAGQPLVAEEWRLNLLAPVMDFTRPFWGIALIANFIGGGSHLVWSGLLLVRNSRKRTPAEQPDAS